MGGERVGGKRETLKKNLVRALPLRPSNPDPVYSQTEKTVNNMSCKKKANQVQQLLSGVRKLNRKQEPLLVCCFVDCSHVLIFSVIGRNTINIPEIFQVFMVCPVALKKLK